MSSPIRRFFALSSLLAIMIGGLIVAGSAFMVMLPALCLVAPLLLGRYVGERGIETVRLALAARRLRPRQGGQPGALLSGHGLLFRGGRLIAASLAVRPPPHLG